MANKFYTATKEIKGTKYVAQFAGLSTAFRAVDSSYIDGSGNTSIEKLAKFLLDYIIVEPNGLTIDDFESMEELNEVIAFAQSVMKGEFRDKQDQKSAKETSKG